MSLKFSLLLQAIDKVSAPARRIQASVKGIGRAASAMAKDVAKIGVEAAGVTRLDRATRHLVGAFGAAGRAAKFWAGKAGLASWGDAAELAGWGVGRLTKKVGGLALSAAKWAGAAGIGAVTFSLFDLFSTAGQFEAFQTQLNREFGSIAKGKEAMNWINKFAYDTPYELDQVTEAFLRLRSYGIDAMDGSLRSAGDAASGMNTDLMSGVEALADAMTGEYERLKAFGITASQQGKKVRLSWTKDGKAMSMDVAKNALDMKKAITGIWDAKFGGAMISQSTTFFGIISNLKGAWTNFLVMVAQAGVFDLVKGKLQQLLEWVNKISANGQLKAWAEKVSKWLEQAFTKALDFVEGIDWDEAGRKLERLANAALILADAVIKIAQFGGGVVSFLNAGHQIDDWLWGSGSKDGGTPSSAPSAPPRQPPSVRQPRGSRPSFPTGPVTAPPLLRKSDSVLGPPAQRAPAKPTKTASAQDVRVGGRAEIAIKVEGPATARVTRVAQDGDVPMLVHLGRSMAGAA